MIENLNISQKIGKRLRKMIRRCPYMFYVMPFTYSASYYEYIMGYKPNLKHPEDFNQQLMDINIKNYRDKEKRNLLIQCADKYAVRRYVEDKGYGDTLNPLLGVYDSADEIDFSRLPMKYAVKTNYACGQNLIVTDNDALDKKKAVQQLNKWMGVKQFGLDTAEWHYSHIPKKIIVEKYLDQLGEDSVIDYKFHCINGHVYSCLVGYDRDLEHHKVQLDLYDTDWNLMDGIQAYKHPHQKPIPKPKNLQKMLKMAETLSADFEYVRVDLYEIDDKVVFGEMTFTPSANIMVSHTRERLQDMLAYYKKTKR